MQRPQPDIKEDVQFRILRLLADNPELSQRGLARKVGISAGGIHYALSALLEKGVIKLGKFTASPDKRRIAYILTPQGIAHRAVLTRRFLRRKMIEYQALKAEIDAVSRDLAEFDLADGDLAELCLPRSPRS